MSRSVVVSIVCTTYNHREYIVEAVESFLAQKLSVPFEIIIHDDASTDGTREILKSYAEQYPQLIRVIQQEHNIYSTGKRVFDVALSYARGEFVAPCEGDDFWCDPLKLSKQLEFLKTHSEYGAVFTDANVLVQQTKLLTLNHDASRGFCPAHGDVRKKLVRGNPYKSCTAFLRMDALNGYREHSDFLKSKMLDYVIWLHVASNSRIGYLSESTATYRVLAQSASHFSDHSGKIRFEKSAYKVSTFFNKRFGSVVRRDELKSAYAHNMFVYFLKNRDFKRALGYMRCDWSFVTQGLAVIKRQIRALVCRRV